MLSSRFSHSADQIVEFVGDGTSTQLKICTYNVNGGVAADTPFSARAEHIIEMLRMLDCDIVCLQELRDALDGFKFMKFLGDVCQSLNYKFQWASRNQTAMAFAQAILYRPTVYCLESAVRWISGKEATSYPDDINPKGFGSCLLGVLFCPVMDRGRTLAYQRTFAVFNFHMTLTEEDKQQQCDNLVPAIKSCFGIGTSETPVPYLAMGDQNTFYDRDALKQTVVCERDMRDITARPGFGTFIGCESDPFKQPLDKPSFLDHIWVSKAGPEWASILTTPETHMVPAADGSMTRHQPSDHLPVTVYWRFC